jgi:hypothetical protein
MSLGSSLAPFFGAAGAAAGGAAADYSLRFNSADSTYLSRNPTSVSNRRTWTWSGWVKLSKPSTSYDRFFGSETSTTAVTTIRITQLAGYEDCLEFHHNDGTNVSNVTTNAKLRDPSAWYHIVVAVDTTQSTPANRTKIYLNGVEQSLSASAYLNQNVDTFINSTNAQNIGRSQQYGAYFNGYMAEAILIDGQALAATDFGEFNTEGVWNPLSDLSALTYGTNGFKINFNNTASLTTLGEDSSGLGNNYDAFNFTPLGVTAANTDTISTVALESQAVSTFKNRRGGGSNQGAPNNTWASSTNMGDQVINVGSTFNASDPSVINWNSDAWLYFELNTASAVTIGYPSLIAAQEAVLYGSNNGGSSWTFIAKETNRGRRITSTTAYQYYAYANPGQNIAANDWTILPAKTVLTLASSQDLNKIFENDFVQQDSSQTLSTNTISGFTRLDYANGATFGGNLNTLSNAFRPEYNSVPPWQPQQATATADFTNLGLYATSIGVWCTFSNNASGWNIDGSRLTVNGVNVSSTATAVAKSITGWASSAYLVTHTFATPTLLTTVDAYAANASNYVSGYYINGVKLIKGDTKLTLTGSTNLSSFASGDTIYQDNASTGPVYSSTLTGTTGGSSTVVTTPENLYDGDLGSYPRVYGTGTNTITHNTTLSNVQRLEVYLETGNTSTKVYVNGVGPHTNTGAGWNDLGPLIPGNGIVTSIQFEEYYGGSSYYPRPRAIRVNGQILLNADQTPNGTVLASAPNGNQLLLSGTGGTWSSSSTQTAQVTKVAGNGYVFAVDSNANTIKLVNVANTWLGGVGKYVIGPNTYASNQNTDTLTDHPSAAGSDTGVGGEVRGNYCTWNPLDKGSGVTASNGNLVASCATTGINGTIALPASGKYYFEITYSSIGSDTNTFAGLMYLHQASGVRDLTAGGTRLIVRANAGVIYNDSTTTATTTLSAGDVLGVAVDCGANSVQFYRNGSTIGSAQTPSTAINGANWAPWCGTSSSTSTFTLNAGQRPFANPSVPSGFKALCTANLTPPTIAEGSTVMAVTPYIGNGTTLTISGLEFSPDLVWIKGRDFNSHHRLYDQIRLATNSLRSSSADAEIVESTGLTAFTSDGFTLGSDPGHNNAGQRLVAWTWDAGTLTATNNDGSISSQVRANTSAGFSVVTYNAGPLPPATGATVGHGLGVAPQFIIVKDRTNANGWAVYHSSLGPGKALVLNSTAAVSVASTWWDNTAPSSTVFSINSDIYSTAQPNDDYVAYCWTPVANYSAFGSFIGNGSSDGPFVYTGFRPKFLLYKCSSVGGDWWNFVDTARATYNVVGPYLENGTQAEGTGSVIDVLSNGFKLRFGLGNQWNGTGQTYVYAAFAEHPFQTARAR